MKHVLFTLTKEKQHTGEAKVQHIATTAP